jgi:hypothetical protein
MNSFKPYKLDTKKVTLSGASQRIELPQPARSGDVIKVSNIGTATAFLRNGDSTITASTTVDMPQLANSVETYSLDQGDTHVAINGVAGSDVYVTQGVGL